LDVNSNCSDFSIEEDVNNFIIEERADQILEPYLAQPRLGRSLATTADQRAELLKSKSLMILKWWEERCTMDKLLQKQVPSRRTSELKLRQEQITCLSKVAMSLLGPATTSYIEGVFSQA